MQYLRKSLFGFLQLTQDEKETNIGPNQKNLKELERW